MSEWKVVRVSETAVPIGKLIIGDFFWHPEEYDCVCAVMSDPRQVPGKMAYLHLGECFWMDADIKVVQVRFDRIVK